MLGGTSVALRPLDFVAGAGPTAPACRSGGSWVSQGTSGRKGVFAEDCLAGWEPRKAKGATPVSCPTSGLGNGAIVLVPPPPSTRNSWPFASPERLSPATPVRPYAVSW